MFAVYERAPVGNDVAALDGSSSICARHPLRRDREPLWDRGNPRLSRRAAVGGPRATLERTQITTYGRDLGIAATLFRRANAPGKIGRQMQTWVRFPQGWRIVAAHISVIDEPKGS